MVADAVDLVTTREGLILTVEVREYGIQRFRECELKEWRKVGLHKNVLDALKML